MTNEEKQRIKEHLKTGKGVSVDVWYFSESVMTCGDGCCWDTFDSTRECVLAITSYAGNKFSNVIFHNE